jgi:hypothetical protein
MLEGSVATNKSCDKADFDWGIYDKALRRLTPAQEEALREGHLRPLLDFVLAEPEVRFDIRPDAANIYFDGGSLMQLKNGTQLPFKGTFSRGYVGEKGHDVNVLDDLAAVEREVEGFAQRRRHMREHDGEGYKRAERRIQQFIARANGASSSLADAGDYVVIDIEYAYARRKFDLVLFDRSELPRPRLIYGELKCRSGALNGKAGLQQHGIDFGDFLCAEGGRHVELSKREYAGVIEQKQRLGLLSPDLDFDGFSAELPEFLVLFADYEVSQAGLRTPVARMRAEIEKRLGSLDLLRFADFPEFDDDGNGPQLRLCRERVMDSEQFDARCRERAH